MKKYIVRLSSNERNELVEVIKKLKGTSQKVKRAQILLKADAGGSDWSDTMISEAFCCRVRTIENIRKRFVTEGFEAALIGKKRESPPVPKKLDANQEAQIIALRLGAPPKGFANWSLRLLANHVIELDIVDSISHECIRQTLKKNGMTKRKIQYWVIPPEADGEFVASMEEVLETYAQPYDKAYPVLCMDEQPVQLLKETRQPIAATKNHPRRVDYEYERAGTASIFMFCEPLAGWREVSVRPRRTKIDWAEEMAHLLETRYKNCEKVILVCDNLNTHTRGAFYEAFPAEKARELVEKIEFRYTPKHGSWLNISENELSSMTRQCLKYRKISDLEMLGEETKSWSTYQNENQRGVDWQFKLDDARTKLKSLYPKIKL